MNLFTQTGCSHSLNEIRASCLTKTVMFFCCCIALALLVERASNSDLPTTMPTSLEILPRWEKPIAKADCVSFAPVSRTHTHRPTHRHTHICIYIIVKISMYMWYFAEIIRQPEMQMHVYCRKWVSEWYPTFLRVKNKTNLLERLSLACTYQRVSSGVHLKERRVIAILRVAY